MGVSHVWLMPELRSNSQLSSAMVCCLSQKLVQGCMYEEQLRNNCVHQLLVLVLMLAGNLV